MKFIAATVYTSKAGLEPLSSVLMGMNITDFIIEDPKDLADLINKKNDYDWDYIDESVLELGGKETNITFYLPDTEEGKKILQEVKIEVMTLKSRELEGYFGENVSFGRLYIESNVVDDREWKNNWKEYFKPAKITDRFVIKPTWEQYQKQADELVIEIDPGMAFGTGTHPTTVLCIKLLEKYIGTCKTVLDIGVGSGILSIASALLGAEKVVGIDIDPEAVAVAKQNAALNGLSDSIRLYQGDLTKDLDFKADLVVANLMSELVMLLSEEISDHLSPGGYYISSGILIEKQEEVRAKIKQCNLEIIDIMEEDEWCAILAKMKKRQYE